MTEAAKVWKFTAPAAGAVCMKAATFKVYTDDACTPANVKAKADTPLALLAT